MDCKIVNPNHKDRYVDRQYAEHEDEDGVGVVVEIMVGCRSLRCRVSDYQTEHIALRRLTFSCAWRKARIQVASWTMQATR